MPFSIFFLPKCSKWYSAENKPLTGYVYTDYNTASLLSTYTSVATYVTYYQEDVQVASIDKTITLTDYALRGTPYIGGYEYSYGTPSPTTIVGCEFSLAVTPTATRTTVVHASTLTYSIVTYCISLYSTFGSAWSSNNYPTATGSYPSYTPTPVAGNYDCYVFDILPHLYTYGGGNSSLSVDYVYAPSYTKSAATSACSSLYSTAKSALSAYVYTDNTYNFVSQYTTYSTVVGGYTTIAASPTPCTVNNTITVTDYAAAIAKPTLVNASWEYWEPGWVDCTYSISYRPVATRTIKANSTDFVQYRMTECVIATASYYYYTATPYPTGYYSARSNSGYNSYYSRPTPSGL